MKSLLFVLVAMSLSPAFAMGRAPTDPATYQDILDAQSMTSQVNNRAIAAENGINARVNDLSGQLDALTETKYLIDTSVRIYDAKRVSIEAFNSYDARHGNDFAAGARFTLKLGKSYEERLIEKQKQEIDELKAMVRESLKR